MALFYLNNCHPQCDDKKILSDALKDTITEYQILRTKFDTNVEGVISLSLVELSFKNYSFKDIIDSLIDKEMRNYAFRLFSKSPIESYFDIEDAVNDDKTYHCEICSEHLDAFYLKIAYDNSSILFSLGIDPDIRKNQLSIIDSTGDSLQLHNLHGESFNTQYISEVISDEITSKNNNLDNLKNILAQPLLSTKFIKSFQKCSDTLQLIIIEKFKEVEALKKLSEYVPEVLLKDVTPSKENEIVILELKIRDPIAMRLYFTESNGRHYLASLEKKPLKDRKTAQQDDHIKNAKSMLKQMIQLNS